MEIVASKLQGYNIIRYRTKDIASGDDVFCGEAKWESDGAGGFYPKVFRYWRYGAGTRKGRPLFEMLTEEYAPCLDSGREWFNICLTSLPVGTCVESYDAKGRRTGVRYVGGEDGEREYRLKMLARQITYPGSFAGGGGNER